MNTKEFQAKEREIMNGAGRSRASDLFIRFIAAFGP